MAMDSDHITEPLVLQMTMTTPLLGMARVTMRTVFLTEVKLRMGSQSSGPPTGTWLRCTRYRERAA